MRKLKIIIERSADLYSAYAENADGVWGSGETVEAAKKSLEKTIRLLKKHNKRNVPKVLQGEYEPVYKFDVQSFLNFYKGIFSNAALERITGINQRQIQHYASGLRKPRPAQTKKISEGLHTLAEELMAVEL